MFLSATSKKFSMDSDLVRQKHRGCLTKRNCVKQQNISRYKYIDGSPFSWSSFEDQMTKLHRSSNSIISTIFYFLLPSPSVLSKNFIQHYEQNEIHFVQQRPFVSQVCSISSLCLFQTTFSRFLTVLIKEKFNIRSTLSPGKCRIYICI